MIERNLKILSLATASDQKNQNTQRKSDNFSKLNVKNSFETSNILYTVSLYR